MCYGKLLRKMYQREETIILRLPVAAKRGNKNEAAAVALLEVGQTPIEDVAGMLLLLRERSHHHQQRTTAQLLQ